MSSLALISILRYYGVPSNNSQCWFYQVIIQLQGKLAILAYKDRSSFSILLVTS